MTTSFAYRGRASCSAGPDSSAAAIYGPAQTSRAELERSSLSLWLENKVSVKKYFLNEYYKRAIESVRVKLCLDEVA